MYFIKGYLLILLMFNNTNYESTQLKEMSTEFESYEQCEAVRKQIENEHKFKQSKMIVTGTCIAIPEVDSNGNIIKVK